MKTYEVTYTTTTFLGAAVECGITLLALDEEGARAQVRTNYPNIPNTYKLVRA